MGVNVGLPTRRGINTTAQREPDEVTVTGSPSTRARARAANPNMIFPTHLLSLSCIFHGVQSSDQKHFHFIFHGCSHCFTVLQPEPSR